MKTIGDKLPNISLPDIDGKIHNLNSPAKTAIIALFKVGCPTCQYTFPFLERVHQSTPAVQVIGISQDPAADTRDFAKRFGITFPLLLDGKGYLVSNAFGITIVPSLYRVEKDDGITGFAEGWVKDEFAQLVKTGTETTPALFKPGEEVAAFKAG